MVCKDGLSLDATENKGLKHLLMTAAPLYEVPGKKKVCAPFIHNRHTYEDSSQIFNTDRVGRHQHMVWDLFWGVLLHVLLSSGFMFFSYYS